MQPRTVMVSPAPALLSDIFPLHQPSVLLPRWAATTHTDISAILPFPRMEPFCLSGSAPIVKPPMTHLPLSQPWWKPCRGN